MQSIELIRKFLQDRLGIAPELVVSEATLVELGVDSLMLAELMFEAEDRLEITIDSDQTLPVTVGDMAAVMDALLATKSPAA